MEFLSIPLFDDDVYKLLFRFVTNLLVLTVIIWKLYYRKARRTEYLFTYYMIGIIVFFLCFSLKKLELDMGMALGLFAIFGILRYRTQQIEIREMTYLFVVIGISVINALVNSSMSYAEIFTANVGVIVSLAVIERIWFERPELAKQITYEIIENVRPENYQALKSDLEQRTGISIHRIEIGDINYLKDTAKLTVFYYDRSES
jgi:Domain of unknown function (DUF4956)